MEALNGSFGTAYYTYTCITISKSSLQTLAFFTLIYHYSLKMFSISPKYYLLCKRRSDIVFLMEHPVYSNITMYRALILVFLLGFVNSFPQSQCVKDIFSWNFMCSGKEAVILILSWSSLYIAISNYIVS